MAVSVIPSFDNHGRCSFQSLPSELSGLVLPACLGTHMPEEWQQKVTVIHLNTK